MAIIAELDKKAWNRWVKSRPVVVREICRRLPPDRLYRMKSTGQRVTLYSYSEEGSVTVNITGEYNAIVFDRQVFGIDPNDLEECDLPPSDEPIGTMLTEEKDVNALIDSRIEMLHQNGEKHNHARCRLCSARPTSESQSLQKSD